MVLLERNFVIDKVRLTKNLKREMAGFGYIEDDKILY